jgi:hypothetical protein
LGSLHPLRSWRSLGARPLRCSIRLPCPRTRLRGRSSHGVKLLFTVLPTSLPSPSRARAPLLGFRPLQRMQRGGPRPPCLVGPVVAPAFPTAGYGAARRLSQPLSDFYPASPSHHVSGGWRSWGSPFRGFSTHEAPAAHRHRPTLLTFAPAGCALPRPRRGNPQACPTLPRMTCRASISSSSGSSSA